MTLAIAYLVLLLGGGWFLVVRPFRNARGRQRRMQQTLEPGDRVITVGGIVGTVLAVEEDEVRVEIAPGVAVQVVRRGVAGRLAPPSEPLEGPASEESHEEAP